MSVLARAAAACVCVAFPVLAQDPQPTTREPVRVGVGVAINSSFLLLPTTPIPPIGITNLLVPIKVSRTVTLEPELGIFRTSEEQGGNTATFSNTRLGLGALFDLKAREQLTPYVALRLGVGRIIDDDGTTEIKQTTWSMGVGLGAQHFFTPHFSLGGEIQLTRTSIGDEDISPAPPFPIPETSQSVIATAGLAMLRWYF